LQSKDSLILPAKVCSQFKYNIYHLKRQTITISDTIQFKRKMHSEKIS